MNEVYGPDMTPAIAVQMLGLLEAQPNGATVVGLSGDLGAGKTTLVQSIARELGITETITSPTFVIAKYYKTDQNGFEKMVHIDAYRIDDSVELETIGWKDVLLEPNTLVIVEWPERVESLLPEHTKRFSIEHRDTERHITLS